MIVKVFDTGYDVNTYVLSVDGNAIIIDPGKNLTQLKKYINANSLVVKGILLTHGHFDHVGGVLLAQKSFGADAYITDEDYDMLEQTDFTFPDSFFPISVKKFKAKKLGDTIDIDGFEQITVIRAPGHTPGGVCFFFPKDNIMFTGDTLFENSYGRTDFTFSDHDALMESLKNLFDFCSDCTVYPGHGPKTSLAEEREYFFKHVFND